MVMIETILHLNMPIAAITHLLLISNDTIILEECKVGRLLEPFDKPPFACFHFSSLGLIPKHDGGWCTIRHLSAPDRYNINDKIDLDLFTLTYCSMDIKNFCIVKSLRAGTLMSKIDLKMHSI